MTPAQELTQRHGGQWLGRYGILCTPGHSSRDRGTTVHDRDDGRGVIINCFNGDWRDVRDALGLAADARPATAEERRRFARERERHAAARAAEQEQRAATAWNGGEVPTAGGVVYRYAAFRRLPLAAAIEAGAIREHANIYGRPAMLALARDAEGRPRAVQATRLRQDGHGKAPVPSPRTTFGAIKGCAIRLSRDAGDVLAIAEGVETALAFTALHGFPAWASAGTENLRGFAPPKGLRTLYIAGDGDDAGRAAADELASRLRPRLRCVLAIAPAGKDWADVRAESAP